MSISLIPIDPAGSLRKLLPSMGALRSPMWYRDWHRLDRKGLFFVVVPSPVLSENNIVKQH
jgi:hypothetical protein